MPSTYYTVTEQCLDIIMRFITENFDDNALNNAEQIDRHMFSKKNKAVQLKKERQGSTDFPYVCTYLLYDLEDSWTSQTAMYPLIIPVCGLSGDIHLDSSIPWCSPW